MPRKPADWAKSAEKLDLYDASGRQYCRMATTALAGGRKVLLAENISTCNNTSAMAARAKLSFWASSVDGLGESKK
jgi:hypothetical protein